jgi:hypothetical protein
MMAESAQRTPRRDKRSARLELPQIPTVEQHEVHEGGLGEGKAIISPPQAVYCQSRKTYVKCSTRIASASSYQQLPAITVSEVELVSIRASGISSQNDFWSSSPSSSKLLEKTLSATTEPLPLLFTDRPPLFTTSRLAQSQNISTL